MKKLIALITFISFFSFEGNCQDYKNEIGLSFLTIRASVGPDCFSTDFTTPFASIKSSKCFWGAPYYNSMTPKLYISRLLHKNWRIRSSFGKQTYTQALPDENNIFIQQIIKHYTLTFGIQWDFYKSSKWATYLGATALGVLEDKRNLVRTHDDILDTFQDDLAYLFGPQFLLGARYKLSRRFSICSEASLGYGISPISRLSINYHF